MLKAIQQATQEDLHTQDETKQQHTGTTIPPSVNTLQLNAESDTSPTVNKVHDISLLSSTSRKSPNPFTDATYLPKQESKTRGVSFNTNQTTNQTTYKLNSGAHSLSQTQQPSHSVDSHMTDFVKFLARRELVTTGLLQFSDQPESY